MKLHFCIQSQPFLPPSLTKNVMKRDLHDAVLTHMLYIHQKVLRVVCGYVLSSKCRQGEQDWIICKKEQISPFMETQALPEDEGYLPWIAHHTGWMLTVLLCALTGWYLQFCTTYVMTCRVGSPHAWGSLKCRHTRGDFVAETWMSISNFVAVYLRHVNDTDRYYTALMGDILPWWPDGG